MKEYLVLDVRTWVEGRKPKFIQEVYEGQELAITDATLTQEEMLGIKKEKKGEEKDKADVAATPSLA